MINVSTMNKTYVTFDNVGQFQEIVAVFKRLGFTYKNGSIDDAINKVNTSTVNKVICHTNFVMTSKEKVTTVSYKVFMSLSDSLTNCEAGEKSTLNNNKQDAMSTTTRNSASKLNSLRAAKVFKDEEKLEAIVKVADDAQEIADNFIAALDKAEDKANKVCELISTYEDAVDREDIKAIEKTGTLIGSAIKYITKGNKVLAALNSAGEGVVKSEDKTADIDGAKFIGE